MYGQRVRHAVKASKRGRKKSTAGKLFGHWEMDCIEGKKGTRRTLLVLSERKTRREIVIAMEAQTAKNVVASLDKLERLYGDRFSKVFKSITVDNGSEFADCAGMERSSLGEGTRTKLYYCHPYSSWERGTNENINRMIRRIYPKGTDFREVTDADIKRAEEWVK